MATIPEAMREVLRMTLAKTLGISEEARLTIRGEAQRTFEHEAAASFQFYKKLRRAVLVRIVAWYQRSVNRASGRYADRLALAAAHNNGFGPEQRRAIEEEVKNFAREKIAQNVLRNWLCVFLVDRIEPRFSQMLKKVVVELAEHETSLLLQARANLTRATAIYGDKPRMRGHSERPSRHEEPLPRLSLEECLKMKSLSGNRAAQTLGLSRRTIRYLVKTDKLNPTSTGRIVCDEKFAKEYDHRHKATARKQPS